MKKTALILSIAFVAMSLSSCKKAYSCVCNGVGSTAKQVVAQYENVEKKDAEKLCNAYVTTYATQQQALSCSVE